MDRFASMHDEDIDKLGIQKQVSCAINSSDFAVGSERCLRGERLDEMLATPPRPSHLIYNV